jgi:hypothetical protein
MGAHSPLGSVPIFRHVFADLCGGNSGLTPTAKAHFEVELRRSVLTIALGLTGFHWRPFHLDVKSAVHPGAA